MKHSEFNSETLPISHREREEAFRRYRAHSIRWAWIGFFIVLETFLLFIWALVAALKLAIRTLGAA